MKPISIDDVPVSSLKNVVKDIEKNQADRAWEAFNRLVLRDKYLGIQRDFWVTTRSGTKVN